MAMLYGQALGRRAIAERSGALSQFAGVRLMTLGDGVERGVRLLEFRTGSGLRFTVLVDRAMDIADCEHNGRAIGWHSPTGFRNPGLHDGEAEDGLGWLRSFSGLINTCGLDHMLGKTEESAEHYNYPYRSKVIHGIHGRISAIPARLTGYGESWEGDECTLWCEGVIQQATVFGEDLHLIRRIEAKLGGNEILLKDRVVNHGFSPTPHMLLYHIDVGYPVLAEGSRYLAPIREVVWAAHAGEDYRKQGVGYRELAGPRAPFREQVWQFDMAADKEGRVPVALVNDALGFGLLVETRKAEFPAFLQWQNLQSGHYTLGIEPSTNHVPGRHFARERDELIILDHGEERRYTTRLEVLDGKAAIAAAENRIRAIHGQPEEDYPEPSGRFPKIEWRGS
jgi:hypothetical protein